MNEFLDPVGRTLFPHTRPDGKVEVEVAPGQAVCDFCLAPNPSWEYPCGPVAISGHVTINASDDDWAACDACHDFIEVNDVNGLVAHMIEMQAKQPKLPGFFDPPLAARIKHATANVTAFLEARDGPGRPFTP